MVSALRCVVVIATLSVEIYAEFGYVGSDDWRFFGVDNSSVSLELHRTVITHHKVSILLSLQTTATDFF